ncbi:MAG: PH domain-containing protein [Flavobacteriales bacterium]
MNRTDFSELERQNPKGIVINYSLLVYKVLKSFWVLIPIFFTKSKELIIDYVVPGLIVLGIVLLIISILQFLFFKFKIENGHFILNQGVFFKKKTSIPFDRIQNVNFKQNIIHQIINITQVEIQTAGAKDVEVSIKAISREKAEALKARLQESDHQVVKDENQEIPVPKSKVLFKLSFLELLKVSVSENHIKSFLAIFAIISSLYWQFKDYFEGYVSFPKLVRFYHENEMVIRGSIKLMFLMSVLVILISILISFVKVVLKHFDQKVSVLNDGIQLSQGLFTKRDDVLKIKKIQYIVVVTNPLKRQLGIQSVKVNQAGSARTKAKKRIEIVGVKNEVLKTLRSLFFKEENQAKSATYKPAPYYLFKLFLFSFYGILIVNVVMFFAAFTFKFQLFVTVGLICYTLVINILKYKKAYFHIEDKRLIVGAGGIATITTVMEFYKTQNIKLVQSFIQKRRGVASVHLQTASGTIKMPNLHKEEAQELMTLILEEACNSNKDWI